MVVAYLFFQITNTESATYYYTPFNVWCILPTSTQFIQAGTNFTMNARGNSSATHGANNANFNWNAFIQYNTSTSNTWVTISNTTAIVPMVTNGSNPEGKLAPTGAATNVTFTAHTTQGVAGGNGTYWIRCNLTNGYDATSVISSPILVYIYSNPFIVSLSANDSAPRYGDPVYFSVNWQPTANLTMSGYIFSNNFTGWWSNSSYASFSGSTWSNQTNTSTNTTSNVYGWRVYVNNSQKLWNDTGIQAITFAIQIKYSLNSTNSTVIGTPVLHSLNWTDSKGLSGYIFSFDNGTGTLANGSWVVFNSNTWSNVTKVVNSTINSIIRWCVYANDTVNNWNGTSCTTPFSYTTTDTTPPIWTQAQDNSSFKIYRGQVVNISTVWQDNNALNKSWLSTNETDGWKNYTDGTYGSPRILSGAGPTTVNFTWQNQTGRPRVIGWIIYANDTSNNENGTNSSGIVINFTMWGWSNITWTSPSSGSSYSIGSTVPLTCFVNDTNTTGSGPIANYTVSFYNISSTAESSLGTNSTNSSGYAVYYWGTTGLSAGTYYPKCNITSNSTLYYNASEYSQSNTTIRITGVVYRDLSQSISLSSSVPKIARSNRIEILGIIPTASNIRTKRSFIFLPQSLSVYSLKANFKSIINVLTQSFDVVKIFNRLRTVPKAFSQMLNLSALFKTFYSRFRTTVQSLQINDAILKLRTVPKLLSQALSIEGIAERIRIINRAISQSLQINDVITRLRTVPRLLSQAIGVTDTVERIASIFKSLSQSVNITDIITRLRKVPTVLSQAIGVNAAIERMGSIFKILSQSLGIKDIITKLRTVPITISQSLQVNTLIERTISLLRTITQSLSLLTSIIAVKVTALTQEFISQAINISAISKKVALNLRTFSQALGLNDIVTKIRSVLRALSQSIGITDAIKSLVSIFKNLSQSLSIADVITKLRTVPKTISESINLNTVITRLYKSIRELPQSLGISGVIERLRTVPKTLSQLLNVNILVSRVYSGLRVITQAFDITSIITKFRIISRFLGQTIGVSDLVERIIGFSKILSQLLDVNGIITRLRTVPKILTQAVNVNDLIIKVYSGFRALAQSFSLNTVIVKIRTVLKNLSQSMGIQTVIEKLRTIPRMIAQSLQVNTFTKSMQSILRSITQSLTLFGKITTEVITAVIRKYIGQVINLSGISERITSSFKTFSQSLGINEIITRLRSIPRAIAQALNISDIISKLRAVPKVIGQFIGITDKIEKISSLGRAIAQFFNMNDVIKRLRTVPRILSETLNLNDTIKRLYSSIQILSQTLSIDTIATKMRTVLKELSQSLTTNVVITRLLGITRILSQSVNLASIVDRLRLVGRSISESLGLNDIITKLRTIPRVLSETLNVNDAIKRLYSGFRALIQGIDLSTVIERLRTVPRAISQFLQINDVITRLRTVPRFLSQSLGISDIVKRIGVITKIFGQSVNLATIVNRFRLVGRIISQSLGLSDIVTRLRYITQTLSQSLSVTNLTTKIFSLTRIISQSILAITGSIGKKAFETYEKIVSIAITLSDITRRLLYASRTMTGSFAIGDVTKRLTEFSRAISQAINLDLITTRVRTVYRTILESILILFRLIFPCWIYPTQGSCEITGCNWCNNACQSQTCPGVTITAPPGGGGRGAGPSFEIFVGGANFTIDKDFIKVLLKPGETDKGIIVISNTGNKNLTITVNLKNLEDFLVFPEGVSEYEFYLDIGKEKSIQLNFFASEDQEPGVYPGKVVVTGDGIEKVITIVIEVESEKPLFDIDVEIPQKYKEVLPGEEVLAQLTIYNIKRMGRVDVDVEYGLKDSEGNIIVSKHETLAVEMQVSIVRSLDVPFDAKPDNYVVYAIVKYDNTTGTGTDILKVTKKEIGIQTTIILSFVLIAVVMVSIFLLTIMFIERKIKNYPNIQEGLNYKFLFY
jgi:hypothetical protein